MARTCPVRQRRRAPKATLRGVAVERQRLGINLVSLMTALWGEGRLSIRTIQWYLKTMYGWKLSTGGIVGAIHGVARQAEPAVAKVLDLMRARWCTPTKPDGTRTWKTAMSGPTALPPDGANPGQTVHPVGRRADGRGRHWQQATAAARYPVMSDAELLQSSVPRRDAPESTTSWARPPGYSKTLRRRAS